MRIFWKVSHQSQGLMWLLAEPTTELKQPGVLKDEGPMVNPRSEILFPLTCMHTCVCVYLHVCLRVHACVCQVEVRSQPQVSGFCFVF